MGLLHKLWDETLAGPTPESGLGKLRKYDSFSASRSSSSSSSVAVIDHPVLITRSITIVRSNSGFRNLSIDPPPPPESPASSSSPAATPLTPGTPPGGDDFKRFTRRKPFEQAVHHEPTSPTVYDWILISALDR